MNSNTYFKNYFNETSKVNGYEQFVENGDDFFEYNFTNSDLAKIFSNMAESDKLKIMDVMTKIDFQNGNMQHFVDYMMKEWVRRDVESKSRANQNTRVMPLRKDEKVTSEGIKRKIKSSSEWERKQAANFIMFIRKGAYSGDHKYNVVRIDIIPTVDLNTMQQNGSTYSVSTSAKGSRFHRFSNEQDALDYAEKLMKS